MFKVINHQGNANHDHKEKLPHPSENSYYKETKKLTNASKDVVKEEF